MTAQLSFTIAVSFAVVATLPADTQDLRLFSIGTGGTGATYYPLGGTIANAIQILEFYDLSEEDVDARYLKSTPAAEAIIELAERADITLVPISGRAAQEIIETYPFYNRDTVPAGVYAGIDAAETLAVGAQWVTDARVDDNLVYNITAAFWNERSRTLLDVGHATGGLATRETALDGVAIPFRSGAERFYLKLGKIE